MRIICILFDHCSLYLIGLNSIVDSNLLNWSSGDMLVCSWLTSIFCHFIFCQFALILLSLGNSCVQCSTAGESRAWAGQGSSMNIGILTQIYCAVTSSQSRAQRLVTITNKNCDCSSNFYWSLLNLTSHVDVCTSKTFYEKSQK